MKKAITLVSAIGAAALLSNACSSNDSNGGEPIGSSSAALEQDLGGSRDLHGTTHISTIGFRGTGGPGGPGGPPGFCYFTQVVGAFQADTDSIKIEPVQSAPNLWVWSYQTSGGPTSPFATVHCITFDQFSGNGLDPNTYGTFSVGPATAVQTGPTLVNAGTVPLWPAPPPPPPPSPSNFDTIGWFQGHLSTAASAAWLSSGLPFGPNPATQHSRGGCYVDEDPAPASGCGGTACSLTSKYWSSGGNTWIESPGSATVNTGNFTGFPLSPVASSVCFINGISGDWSSPTTSLSVTQSGGRALSVVPSRRSRRAQDRARRQGEACRRNCEDA